MSRFPVFILSLTLVIGVTGALFGADAAQRYDSNIRKAAIERMETKLGTLRGSIAPKARNVRLTDQMIEMIAPVRRQGVQSSNVSSGARAVADIDRPGSAQIDKTITASSKPSRKRIKRSKRDVGSSDVRDIMKAVDAMLQDN